jgi:hypothetical protein
MVVLGLFGFGWGVLGMALERIDWSETCFELLLTALGVVCGGWLWRGLTGLRLGFGLLPTTLGWCWL